MRPDLRLSCRLVALALALGSLAFAAAAQTAPAAAPASRDEGLAGATILAVPRYAGSDQRRTRLLPYVSYRWANGWFAGIENGVGYNFSGSSDIQYGLRLTPDFGRDEDDADALRGMGDVDPSLEPGGFFEQRWANGLSVRTSLRYGSGNDHQGMLVELGTGFAMPLPPRSRLSLGLSTTYANRAYMQAYFGVDADQAARSGYAVYTPDAGLRDLRASLALLHQLGAGWGLNVSLTAVRLLGDSVDSPIVLERNYLLGILGAAYRF